MTDESINTPGAPAAGAEGAVDPNAAPANAPADTGAGAPAAAVEDGDKVPAGDNKPADKAEGAPETYEAFAMPEGATLQPEVAADLTALAKELNLTQAQAQKVADLGVKQSQRYADMQAEAVTKAREGWVKDIKADKEFGGDNLNTTLAAAKGALDRYGSPELKKLLDDSGLGDHPEVIRFVAKVGKATGDDKIVTGDPPTGPKDAAAKLYPTMAQG